MPHAAQFRGGAAAAAGAVAVRATAPAAGGAGSRGVAHFLQNLAMGRLPVPHAGQVLDKGRQQVDGGPDAPAA